LNEAARVMTRNGFALVDGKYMVTTSDILRKLMQAKCEDVKVPPLKKAEKTKKAESQSGGCCGISLKWAGIGALFGAAIVHAIHKHMN